MSHGNSDPVDVVQAPNKHLQQAPVGDPDTVTSGPYAISANDWTRRETGHEGHAAKTVLDVVSPSNRLDKKGDWGGQH